MNQNRFRLEVSMLSDKQYQKAGDNSNQLQAETINLYNTTNVIGITEERAVEIVDEKIQTVMQNFSEEAYAITNERINEYSKVLVPKLVREELLDYLMDPSVQILLLETEKSATASGKKNDYELLSELLIHRVKKGNNRNVMAAVNHAVKIVDEISDEALQGLTLAHSIEAFIPVNDTIEEELKNLDVLFSKLIYDKLPLGNEWLDHLDILNAVRINHFGGMKKMGDFYTEQLSGYVDVGIMKSSDNYSKAIGILNEANVPLDVLVDHELRDGYVRLKLINRSMLDLLYFSSKATMNLNGLLVEVPIQQMLNDKQKKAINQVYELYDKNEQLHNENTKQFIKLMNDYDNIRKVGEWWDSINVSFVITSVGKVLAHANAQKCDPELPPLD